MGVAIMESRPSKPPPPRRPQHTAMRDVGGNDDSGQRARAGGGVKSTERSGSPPRGPRSDNRGRHRPPTRPGPSQQQPSNDISRPPPPENTRQKDDRADLIPRYRPSQPHDRDPDPSRSRRDRSRDRGRPSSPSSVKRHRSRSPSFSAPHRKRHRKHQSSRNKRGRKSDSNAEHRRRHSPDRRRTTQANPHASPTVSEPASSRGDRTKPRPDSSGGQRSELVDRRREPRGAGLDHSRPTSRSRSPPIDGSHDTDRPEPSRRDPDPVPSVPEGEPVSDRERQATQRRNPNLSPIVPNRRRRRGESNEPHSSARSEVDDDMASHSSYRGGYAPVYSQNTQYHDDPRGFPQSPQHPGSYHDSPSQSPFGAGRSGWGNNRFSPQNQHPPNYPTGPSGYAPPTGPSGSYHANQSHHAAYPTAPQANYRGGHRGGNFRGGAPYQGRGGPRGNSKNPQWNPGNHSGPSHAHNPELPQGPSDSNAEEADNQSFRPSSDGHDQPSHPGEHDDGPPRGPANRAPPTGPSGQGNSSAKFSFAFKPSKPTPTGPKPEISQKFNAGPQRRQQQSEGMHPDRAPPPSAPTEPASARPRHDGGRKPPEGPRGDVPRTAPRMRKVKKTMKKPKPRPALEPHLVSSDSVFFRKPGNESVVGSGTYGKVFKGLNVYTKGQVALKRIRMEGERDGFPVTAVREIKLLQSLRHLNIVNLQEVMVERNDCFMVFEYLSHDLTGILNHPTFKLEDPQKKDLARQLFEGLDYLHTRGVLHRDIKAANILVSNEGILKIADFGLARFYAKHHQLDYTNRVITIWYRSPELLLGETRYTAAVDVWSAACVMVEIFTRHAIFPGDGTELSQLDKIYNVLGTPNRQEWPGLGDMAWFELLKPSAKRKNVFSEKYGDRVTPAAFELLASMFQYDPDKRPTAAEVLQHAYFTTEEPTAEQAVELSNIGGDWHEFESKALRKENERKDREARRVQKDGPSKEKEKKRANDSGDPAREAKRVHVEQKPAADDPITTDPGA